MLETSTPEINRQLLIHHPGLQLQRFNEFLRSAFASSKLLRLGTLQH
jgi:hypothetical protein